MRMKITTITHKPPSNKKPALNFLKSKQDHPHTTEREYMKALNSVKLDKLFAKPFVKQFSLNEGITSLQINPYDCNEILALTYSNEVSIINIRKNKIRTMRFDEHIKAVGYYYTKDKEIRIYIVTQNDISIVEQNIFSEDINDTRKYLLRKLGKPESLTKQNEFKFFIRAADFCKTSGLLYLATDAGIIAYKEDGTYTTIFNKEIDRIKVSKELICASSDSILYVLDSVSYTFLREYKLSLINDISISHSCISVACEDSNIHVVKSRELDSEPKLFLGHTHAVTSCYLNITKNILISGSFDKSIRIYNIKSRRSDILYSQRMSEINCIGYSDLHDLIFSGSNDGSIRVWKTPNGKLGLMNKKQATDLKYRKLLVNKFAGVKEIEVIGRSRNLPRELKGNLKNKYEQRKAEERRRAVGKE